MMAVVVCDGRGGVCWPWWWCVGCGSVGRGGVLAVAVWLPWRCDGGGVVVVVLVLFVLVVLVVM